ncbi:MAG TPA: acyltransferase [Acidimicrobiales bacterium]|nr:acyltransferase [Acidimicrobiales bacterium]
MIDDPDSRIRRLVSDALNGAHDLVGRWGRIHHGDRRARRFGHFGVGSIVGFPTGVVYGERYIHIGSRTLLADHVTLTAGMIPGQAMVTDPVVRIGDNCMIGRGNSIVGHFSIDIGDGVFTGTNVYVTDQNHVYEDTSRWIGIQDPVEAPVGIGDGTWIGSGAVILPGARIGRHVVVAANSVVRGEIPDHSVVAGVPARVVKTFDIEAGWVRPPTP